MKIQEKEQQLHSKEEDITALRDEIEAKNRELLDKDALLLKKEAQLQTVQHKVDGYKKHLKERDATLREFTQSLQDEVKAKELQLRRLNQQLESNEETTATLQHPPVQCRKEMRGSQHKEHQGIQVPQLEPNEKIDDTLQNI